MFCCGIIVADRLIDYNICGVGKGRKAAYQKSPIGNESVWKGNRGNQGEPMIDQQRTPRFDVVSLGETMLRLSVPVGERLDDARALDVEVGGTESNVCVALARLDWRCGWVSRLPDHALGSAVLRSLRADGIDVSAVMRVPGE